MVGLWVLALFVCFTAVQPAGASDGKPQQLVIGYQAFPTAELVVKDLGCLEKELGIPVKWVRLTSGMQGLPSLSAGKIDIALLGNSPAAARIAKGVPLQVIWVHDIIGENEALVVRTLAVCTGISACIR